MNTNNSNNKLESLKKSKVLHNLLQKLQIAEQELGIDILQELQHHKTRTSDVTQYKHKTWNEFNLHPLLIRGISEMNFLYPSPVQFKTIPLSLKNKSLVVRAKNGTGKTAAYLIPILNKINIDIKTPQALILVPTRELALQVSKVARKLSTFLNIDIIPTYGGTNLHEDILRIKKGINIIISTPGRIIDLVERNIISFKECKIIIFDEADKLLSLEFKNSLNSLLSLLPEEKVIQLFSATFPLIVQEFVSSEIKDVVHVNLMRELSLVGVSQFYALVSPKEKLHCLRTLLSKVRLQQCIIFCNSIYNVELLAMKVTDMGFPSYFIHSRMSQDERNKVFFNFTEGKCRILVCSDLVTRGIDVPNINCVINFDFPRSAESYLHRIGRSGRFGSKGLAISFLVEEDKQYMLEIEEQLMVDILPVSDVRFKDYWI